jgi:hypothetical protein
MEISTRTMAIRSWKPRLSPIFMVPLLALLSGGCATYSNAPLEDPLQPGLASFTADPTPDQPNYYWMTDSQFAHGDLARDRYFQPKIGTNAAGTGDVSAQAPGAH